MALGLAKLRPEDDPQGFLWTLEWVVKAADWEDLTWAACIAPLLTGEAQAANQAVSDEQADSYPVVRAAILDRLGPTPGAYGHRVQVEPFLQGAQLRVVAQKPWDLVTQRPVQWRKFWIRLSWNSS